VEPGVMEAVTSGTWCHGLMPRGREYQARWPMSEADEYACDGACYIWSRAPGHATR
jgi:hypothetical protein